MTHFELLLMHRITLLMHNPWKKVTVTAGHKILKFCKGCGNISWIITQCRVHFIFKIFSEIVFKLSQFITSVERSRITLGFGDERTWQVTFSFLTGTE